MYFGRKERLFDSGQSGVRLRTKRTGNLLAEL
ncbi:hypothetical protein SAMN05444682_102557 [Parapedobacter indicus]|uniref:Uncharacterized protein n=1 Tax=Parapedobacter indicus TaxID=1477437 RepID=A0A1I3FZF0_9SPHI|nr:hypothetical protein CLV26_102557 [Parapedobacter indicus]SFI16261.1 hypothetical protein SAMN05444682_102557 [Parapedobacter indicus]